MSAEILDVVVADDSALYRQMLQNVLARIPGTRVVGVARDGAEAVEMVVRMRPHLLTLDVAMPGMDGLAVLAELRRLRADTRVVMVSSLTGAGAPVTVDALLRGAFDAIAKPAGLDPHEVRRVIQAELAEKVDLVRASRGERGGAARPVPLAAPAVAAPAAVGRFAAIAVGASTGGPEALREILPALPAGLPVPVLVVQHIPPVFSMALAARLHDLCRLPVVEAADGMPVEGGRVHLAPGGRHLTVERKAGSVRCRLTDAPPVLGCRPSFDVLLESAVSAYEGRIAAAVLTGMGTDGLAGCRAVKAAGGIVVVQHREDCAVWGMPKAVEEEGLADVVARLDEMAGVIVKVVVRPAEMDRTRPGA